jgi:hypothetical protein
VFAALSDIPSVGNSLADMTKLTKDDEFESDDSGILSRNLGLDIIVVITKTDTMTQLGTVDKFFIITMCIIGTSECILLC